MRRWGEELGATPILGLQVHGWMDWPGLAWPGPLTGRRPSGPHAIRAPEVGM